MSTMLAPARRAVFQCFLVASGSPAKNTKSMPAKDSASTFWMKVTSSPVAVICPASSSSSSTKSLAASDESASASVNSLPASEDAPTIPIRYVLPAINALVPLQFALACAEQIQVIHRFDPCKSSRGQSRPPGAPPPPAPGVCQSRKHSGDQIAERNDHQHQLG